MADEREFISRVESADADELAKLLERPSRDEEKALRAYLGDARYQRLHLLALKRKTRALARRRGNVVVIHGIMGAELSSISRTADSVRIWLTALRLMDGGLERLRLSSDGRTDADGAFDVRATGILKRHYGELLLALSQRWNVRAFWFDWRKDLNHAAAALDAQMTGWFGDTAPVHIVAHSMGGLARADVREAPERALGIDVGRRTRRGRRRAADHAGHAKPRVVRDSAGDHRPRGPRPEARAARPPPRPRGVAPDPELVRRHVPNAPVAGRPPGDGAAVRVVDLRSAGGAAGTSRQRAGAPRVAERRGRCGADDLRRGCKQAHAERGKRRRQPAVGGGVRGHPRGRRTRAACTRAPGARRGEGPHVLRRRGPRRPLDERRDPRLARRPARARRDDRPRPRAAQDEDARTAGPSGRRRPREAVARGGRRGEKPHAPRREPSRLPRSDRYRQHRRARARGRGHFRVPEQRRGRTPGRH